MVIITGSGLTHIYKLSVVHLKGIHNSLIVLDNRSFAALHYKIRQDIM